MRYKGYEISLDEGTGEFTLLEVYNMNKPEKKEITDALAEVLYQRLRLEGKKVFAEIRNQAIDDYEEFLPSEEEIIMLINRACCKPGSVAPVALVAKAIAKRIGK